MKRLLLLSLLLCAAPLCKAGLAADREVFVGLAASVLRIEAPGQRGFSLGSAVVVAGNKVVTNCHVTRDAREVFVVRGGMRWRAVAQASHIERDLCLFDVPGLDAPPVKLLQGEGLILGQTVTALGYSGGMGIQSSTGEVVELHRHDGSRVIQSSNWFSSGASGGGLFDEQGRLVGILTFRLRGGEAHYFAAPAAWVGQMLAGAEGARAISRVADTSAQRHYWQHGGQDSGQSSGPGQPRFLKAALLLRDARWPELEAVASEWSRSDPDDSEPWHLLGTALAQQGRAAAAQLALQCSLWLAPQRAFTAAHQAALRDPTSNAPPSAAAQIQPNAQACRTEAD
jgi:serine protease Do